MIQRWTIDAREYVTYADHVAREAELMRLLKKYQDTHNRDCNRLLGYDCPCRTCKAVDALGVSK